MKVISGITFFSLVVCHLSTARADFFGSHANQFAIEFVPIGDVDNPDYTLARGGILSGKVEYAYRMGKYEISRDMIAKANNEGSLGITMDSMSFVTNGPRDDMPATGITWFEAAMFVNWLNTSQGHQAAYNFDAGGNFQLWSSAEAWQKGGENLFRHRHAYYFLPSMDEWSKAGHYNPSSGTYNDYPTGSSVPNAVASGTAANTAVYLQSGFQGPADINLAGGLSSYGTMGQGGNVWEWEETAFSQSNNSSSTSRGTRGGFWSNFANNLHIINRGFLPR